jgi:murein DD-endopeptidase
MNSNPSRKLVLALWLVLLAALQGGCGAGKKLPPLPWDIDPAGLIQTARGQLGAPYLAGGSMPTTGFDCSGFTQWVYCQHGVTLPRQSYDQYQLGEGIRRQRLRAGDLVFFDIETKGASHVGIYVDRGRFIHSSSTGGRVREDFLGNPYWTDHYLGARRVLP